MSKKAYEYELHPRHDQPDFRGLKSYKGYPELMRQRFVFPHDTFTLVVHRMVHRICENVDRAIGLATNRHVLRYCIAGGGMLEGRNGKHELKPGRLFVATRGERYANPAGSLCNFEDWLLEFSIEDHVLGAHRIEEIETVHAVQVPRLYHDLPAARRRRFERRLFRLVDIMAARRPGYTFRVREQILAIVALSIEWGVIRLLNLRKETFSRHWHHYLWVQKAKQYMDSNFACPIALPEIGRHAGVDPGYLNRLFKAELGLSMNQYLTDVRIRNAKNLMYDGVTNVTEIALAAGFRSPSYFSTRFRRATGRSPREYMQGLKP